jgi:hypothetical protein
LDPNRSDTSKMEFPLAYLDAGSGAMLLQLIVGGAAGVAAFARYRWRRMTRRMSPGDAEAAVTEDASTAQTLEG